MDEAGAPAGDLCYRMTMTAELIDRIYECAFVPELWPGVLDDLAAIADGEGGLLFAGRDRVLNWTSSATLEDTFRSYVNDGWFARCSRRVCLFGPNPPAFLAEHDFWTPEQLDANPIYRDFFRPRGLGWSAGTGLPIPTGDNIVFSVERAFERGPMEREVVGRLTELRPHLARSALIAARLGLQRATGASETLSALGLPTALIDASGRLVAMNALMEALGDHVKGQAHDRIVFGDAGANPLLRAALDALQADPGRAVQSFPLRDAERRAVMVAHIVPINRSARDIFARSYALLSLTPVAAKAAPPAELIRVLFDLTASEARVARGLAGGDTLDDIAAESGTAISTVRSHLKAVMEKTGCSRQAELVALMSNIGLVR
jgi:DNA-binding CsgD family transcriptional regulator